MKRYIKAYIDDGQGYWYHARHGVGPGTIPSDVKLLKVVEDPENSWKDYFLLDRALTTEELNEYDLKEKCPPSVNCSTSVKASTVPGMSCYRKMSPAAEKDAFSYLDDEALESMGYGDHHIMGWYEAKPGYYDRLQDQGLSEMMLIDDGTRKFLGYVVGNRLFELEEYDLEGCLDEYSSEH